MKQVSAPWRIQYILGKKSKKCFLCINKRRDSKKKKLILAETLHCYVILNKYPYTSGHLMVIPKKHVADLDGLTQEELTDFFLLVRAAAAALKKALRPDGLNMGVNLGKVAGASAEDHFHFHIVARWNGDHNFMPVIGNTMVISEYLEETYKRLLPYFQKLEIKL
ncbi:MAG: HIT domain-containing protein [Pseudomonadota bacterium]